MLVSGGISFVPHESSEVYDPVTNSWFSVGSMSQSRASHIALQLQDGKILVAGGVGSGHASAELYDPSEGAWASTGDMAEGRQEHTATLLNDGRVLVAGGFGDHGPRNRRIRTAETYDPTTGEWSPAGSMRDARSGHVATLLEDGQVLVTGGLGEDSILGLASAEIYDPATNIWSSTPRVP